MSYQVIARKWRPQSFEEMVGQETVTRTLMNALTSGRIAHAFLFSGVRGVGKTTVARILAKALNCQQGISPIPCQQCVSCEEVKAGNSVDVQEIDAASNRGIDSIRELRESVRYGTARDRFKIFIIDEVHMLTNEAFNALLKTLEEPPPHVKFIMATTEQHKIPTTITSRCQNYEFKPIPYSAIFERLKLIMEAENVSISDYALGAVASMAQGSMRDAQSALDQILAFSGSEVHDDDVRALLGVVDFQIVADVMDDIARGDRAGLINRNLQLSTSGISPQIFCGKLVEHVRNLLVCKAAGWDESLLQLPDSRKDQLVAQAGQFSEIDLIRFYDVLSRTGSDLRWHSQPLVHLELTLLKLIEVAKLRSIEEVIGQLDRADGVSDRTFKTPVLPVQTRQKKPSESDRKAKESIVSETESEMRPSSRLPAIEKAEPPEVQDQYQDRAEESEISEGEPIRRLMNSLKKDFVGLYEQMRLASKVTYTDGRLRISFPDSGQIYATMIGAQENRKKLSETFASIVGSAPQIDVVIDQPDEGRKRSEDPRENPRVKSFLSRFPGRVTVRKDLDE